MSRTTTRTLFVLSSVCTLPTVLGCGVEGNDPLDPNEPRDIPTLASPIRAGETQTHSILPAGDEDLFSFTLSVPADVVIETSGNEEGDTVIRLYGTNLEELDRDDDGGDGLFSKIMVPDLPAGTYFFSVAGFSSFAIIQTYEISLSVHPNLMDLLAVETREPYIVRFNMRLRNATGHAIGDGVGRENFLIEEQGRELDRRETNQFLTSGPNLPLRLVLVLDYTGSMEDAEAIDDMVAAAGEFVQASHFSASHEIGIVAFSDRAERGSGYREIVTLTRADEKGKEQLVAGIPAEGDFEHGATRVWDAVDLAMDMLIEATHKEGEVRAVAFLTDARDTSSVMDTGSLRIKAESAGITLYPIGFGDIEAQDEAEMHSLAEATHGTYFPAADAAILRRVFAQIVEELRGLWNLSYVVLANSGHVDVRVTFEWQGATAFIEENIDADSLQGDIHQGVIEILDRTYDSVQNQTKFLLQAAYIPRNIDRFRFIFDQQAVSFVLQRRGGLTNPEEGWTLRDLGNGVFDVIGLEPLEYGAFGNIGIVTVPGDVSALRVSHDNTVYEDLPTPKTIVLE